MEWQAFKGLKKSVVFACGECCVVWLVYPLFTQFELSEHFLLQVSFTQSHTIKQGLYLYLSTF